MKIFLTGGTGMVGRNFLEHRNASKYNICSPTRKELDLLDKSEVYQFIKNNKPDLIVHAAGTVGGIHANILNPINFLSNNAYMGLNVLTAANELGINDLINVGSSCMYPKAAPNPLTEGSILQGELEPTNEGYAISKILSTRLCEYINTENNQRRYKTIIPCNLFGRYDQFDPKKSHLLAAIIKKISDAKDHGKDFVTIWGDGKARREFMDVSILIDFLYFGIENLKSLPQNINIGLGYDYSVTEYYNLVAKELNYDGKFEYDHSQPSGMKQKLVDISKLKKLNWKPSKSFADSIKEACLFYKLEHSDGV